MFFNKLSNQIKTSNKFISKLFFDFETNLRQEKILKNIKMEIFYILNISLFFCVKELFQIKKIPNQIIPILFTTYISCLLSCFSPSSMACSFIFWNGTVFISDFCRQKTKKLFSEN